MFLFFSSTVFTPHVPPKAWIKNVIRGTDNLTYFADIHITYGVVLNTPCSKLLKCWNPIVFTPQWCFKRHKIIYFMESSVKHLCDSNVNEVGHLTQNIAIYQSKLYKLRIFIFFYLFVFTVLSNSKHSVNNHGNTFYLSDKRANISLRTVCSFKFKAFSE